MSLIEFNNLTKSYGRKNALDNINLKIEKGKIIGLLGPNGSGKTTLIKIINDLLQPTTGTIRINGEKPGINSKRIISYLPDNTYLDMNSTVSETIAYFSDFYDDFDTYKVYNMLNVMNIDTTAKLKTLSKGNKEKVQLALVMSRNADLYVLDEPIGGVDPANRDLILKTILTNFNENATMIISTHLITEIEPILDEVILLNDGQILKHDNTDSLRSEYGKSIDLIFREEFRC